MTITLHGVAASRAARPLWLLEELGVPYTHVSQAYRDGATRTPAFLALNPNGHIPVLQDDGIVVWESMAINLYLARRFAGPLSAANLAEEAEFLRWTFWAVTECEKDALTVLMHRVGLPPERRNTASAEQSERSLARPMSVLEGHLAARPYLAGDRFTAVDVNVASVLSWAQPARELMAAHPTVRDWLERCLDRPAQQKVRQMARDGR